MQIFINRDGQQSGPFTLDEARELLAAGQLLPGDLAWHEGLAEWQLLSDLASADSAPSAAVPLAEGGEVKKHTSRVLIGMAAGGILLIALGVGLFALDPFGWRAMPEPAVQPEPKPETRNATKPSRMRPCRLCGQIFPADEISQHIKICPKNPSSMPIAKGGQPPALEHGEPRSIVIRLPFNPAQLRADAEAGDVAAQNQLARALALGWGMKVDHAESFQWAAKTAAAGDPHGQLLLATRLLAGKGVPMDKARGRQMALRAREPLLKLANEDDAIAQAAVAFYFRMGIGVEKNPSQDRVWLEKSAREYPLAQFLLGKLQAADGNLQEAANWYRKAAEQGLSYGLLDLGAAHLGGKGVRENKAEAMRLIDKAASWDNPAALFSLGIIYEDGVVGDPDPGKADAYFERAARLGHVPAQVEMAKRLGRIESIAWYRLAAPHNEQARAMLKQQQQGMSPKVIASHEQRAREIIPWLSPLEPPPKPLTPGPGK